MNIETIIQAMPSEIYLCTSEKCATRGSVMTFLVTGGAAPTDRDKGPHLPAPNRAPWCYTCGERLLVGIHYVKTAWQPMRPEPALVVEEQPPACACSDHPCAECVGGIAGLAYPCRECGGIVTYRTCADHA